MASICRLTPVVLRAAIHLSVVQHEVDCVVLAVGDAVDGADAHADTIALACGHSPFIRGPGGHRAGPIAPFAVGILMELGLVDSVPVLNVPEVSYGHSPPLKLCPARRAERLSTSARLSSSVNVVPMGP